MPRPPKVTTDELKAQIRTLLKDDPGMSLKTMRERGLVGGEDRLTELVVQVKLEMGLPVTKPEAKPDSDVLGGFAKIGAYLAQVEPLIETEVQRTIRAVVAVRNLLMSDEPLTAPGMNGPRTMSDMERAKILCLVATTHMRIREQDANTALRAGLWFQKFYRCSIAAASKSLTRAQVEVYERDFRDEVEKMMAAEYAAQGGEG